MNTFIRCALGLFMLAFCLAYGQLTRGFISGTVQDATGAVVEGAAVKITNKATNIERTTETNNAGIYRFVAVEPGSYTVEFAKTGFLTKRAEAITVTSNQEVTLNQVLAVSGTVTTVEVEEAAAGVELSKTTATVERTLSQRLISTLPVFSQGGGQRDVNQLALLAPNVVRGPGSTQISASGQRARNNNFLLDGVDNNDLSVTLSNSRTIPEQVAEFQTQSNAYSAEYGRNSGAQLLAITRSGSNEFHGDIFDYYKGNWMEPVNLINKRAGLTSTPRFVQNDAGADVGGRIIRNRLFFFGLFNPQIFRQAPDARNSSTAVIPTPEGYAQLQSVPLGPNQSAQSRQAILNSISFLPSIYQLNPRFANLTTQPVNNVRVPVGTVNLPLANPHDYYNTVGRVDYHLTDNDNLTYRLQLDKQNDPDVTSNLQFGSRFSAGQTVFAQNHALSETHVFGSRMTNEFRFAFIRRNLNFPENDPTTPTLATPGFTVGGLSTFPQGRISNTFQFQNVLTAILGRHSLKFGVDIRRNRLANISDFDSKGTFTFTSFQDFLNNVPRDIILALNTASFDARQTNQFYFFQDDFRVTRDLTLNLGLRYEYSDVPFGFFGATQPEVQASLVPGPVRPDKNNWAPRFGFAYAPSGGGFLRDGKTVVRGGYGVSYDVLFYNILVSNGSNYPRISRTQTDTPNTQDIYPSLPPRLASAPVFNATDLFVNTPSDAQNPTTHFYNLSIQRQLGSTYVLEVGYSGNRSYHGIRQGQLNPGVLTAAQAVTVLSTGNQNSIPPLQQRRVRPDVGSRVSLETTAIGNYNAGYVKFDKRFSHGLTFGGSYTFSKTMSDNDESLGVGVISNFSPQVPQDFNNYKAEYSRSAFDRPHRLALFYSYEVPWFKGGALGNPVVSRVLGGWSIAGTIEAQSGQPFTIRTGTDTAGNGSTGARPNYNSNGIVQKDPVTGNFRTFTIPLNGNGIVVAPLGASGVPLQNSMPGGGNLGRNTFRGPGFQTFGVSFAKNIPITERVRIQLRNDWTNFLNHRNFAPPTAAMNSPSFGQNVTYDPGGRTGFLAAKIIF